MFIEDKELRELYETASKEHLDKLEAGILQLEKEPDDISIMPELLREAHSFKGDSRMLGVEDAELLTHQLETLLQEMGQGQRPMTSPLADSLYQGIDAVRKIAESAVSGTPCDVDIFKVMAQLMGATEIGDIEAEQAPLKESDEEKPVMPDLDVMADAPSEVDIFKAMAQSMGATEIGDIEVEPALVAELDEASTAPPHLEAFPELNTLNGHSAVENSEEGVTVATSEAVIPKSYLIEDEELRTLYDQASKEHLNNLEAGCLHLEKHPNDLRGLTDLLREAHSLKGDSRMLGVQDAETLTHQLESLLQNIHQEKQTVTQTLCDCLYEGLDALRQITQSAVSGESIRVNVDQVSARLIEAASVETDNVISNKVILDDTTQERDVSASASSNMPLSKAIINNEPTLVEDKKVVLPTQELSSVESLTEDSQSSEQIQDAPTQSQEAARTVKRVDTIRVASAKLDALVTQTSELAVTKRRIIEWTNNTSEMKDLWEEWARKAFIHRLSFEKIKYQLAPETIQFLQTFYEQNQQRIETLGDLVQQFEIRTNESGARLDAISSDLESSVLKLRMLPLSNVFNLFPRMVRDLSKDQQKDVELIIEGRETTVDKQVLEEIKAPLSHLLRNAVDHGIESCQDRIAAGKSPTATLRLKGYKQGSSIIIEISDNGRGLDIEKIKQTAARKGLCDESALDKIEPHQVQSLIFMPGFSTRTKVSKISGRGMGLDVVKTNIERLRGNIEVDSVPGQGCKFTLTLNPNLASTYALILSVNQVSYALPVEYIDRMVTVNRSDIFAIKGNLTVTIDDEPMAVAWLSDLLELPMEIPNSAKDADQISKKIACVILKLGEQKLGLFVDALIDQQEVILKPQSKLLKRVRNILGSTILANGEVCLVLNHQDLYKSALKRNGSVDKFDKLVTTINHRPRILLVEDSLPIRTQIKRILEGAGYLVTATVDGQDGYNTLRAQEEPFMAIISDVEMPNLTGLELVAKIRQHAEYNDLPFILVTTLAKDEDKQRGMDAGANAYLTKGDFDQSLLIDTLRGLI